MSEDDPHALAGEYVLGTLSRGERQAFERRLAGDPALRAAVRAWERRLSPLDDATPEAAPPSRLWEAIARILPATGAVLSFRERAELERLRRSRGVWRLAAGAGAALAASLALFIATERGRPQEGLVAVVNRGGDLPALIVRVDPAAGVVRVRSLAAEAPADRSLQLWYIGPGQAPRSLGLVGDAAPAPIPATAEGATIAVSLEPRGGSPQAGPTGPVVYSGRLVREAP